MLLLFYCFFLSLAGVFPGISSVWAVTVTEVVVITDTITVKGDAEPTTTDPPHPPPPPPPPAPAPTTLSTSFTKHCDQTLCSQGMKWCFYWGGITSYDVSQGPIPGETHTVLGSCSDVTTTWPESVVTRAHPNANGVVTTETTTVPASVGVVQQ